MKKIKFLLLGIVSILGISFSSAEITFISRQFGGGNTYNLVPGYNSLSYNKITLNSPSVYNSGVSLIGYSGFNLFPFNSKYIFFDNFIVYNSTDSDISYTPSTTFLTGSFGSSSIFPYYQSGYYGYFDYDITGHISLGQNTTGVLYIGDNSCLYVSDANNYVNFCDLEDHTHCYSSFAGGRHLVCGDGFYYYNSNRYSRSFDYVGVHFESIAGNGGGDSSDPFTSPVDGGIFDFNTFLIEKSILCYMSNGTFGGSYGNCEGLNYSGFVDQYEHVSPIWSGNSESGYVGNIVFNNAESVLTNYCLNTDSIQYQFCSQLNVYSGAYLMYYYENGILDYLVLGDGFGVDLGNLGSGQLGYLNCYGAWCDNINQGLPEYYPTNSGNTNNFGLSGDIISEDFYNDFIEKGFWFTCPYSYSGSYFVIGNDLINRLGGRDILVPINCFISAFSMGSKMLLFGDPQYGLFWNGSLISGDTPGHQRLFLFFDLVLSIGIIFILFKLYNLFISKK